MSDKTKFNDTSEAIIKPFGYSKKKLPKIAIACYTKKIIDYLLKTYNGELLCKVSKTNIYKIKYNNNYFTVFTSPIGAPWATMVLEDLITLGIEKIIYFGSCGVLDSTSEFEILIPTKSLREEGTSYHYIKDKKYISINPKYKEEFINILQKEKINYQLCTTWTTDAPYRETKLKVEKYLKQKIKCVEMEASALATIGIYRKIEVFIFFYAADSLNKSLWEKRCLGKSINQKKYFADLALKLANNIVENQK